jgi:hypothetical protein
MVASMSTTKQAWRVVMLVWACAARSLLVASEGQAAGVVRLGTPLSVQVTLDAPQPIKPQLDEDIRRALGALDGVEVVSNAAAYDVRVIVLQGPASWDPPGHFVSVLFLAPQAEAVQHLEFLKQNLPGSLPAKDRLGNPVDFPVSVPLGYLETILKDSYRVVGHFVTLAPKGKLGAVGKTIASSFDKNVLAPERENARRLFRTIQAGAHSEK